MKKTNLYIGLPIILIFIFGCVYIFINFSEVGEKEININTTPKNEKVFTLNEVSTHNSNESCYTVINGNVYDLTPWIKAHPGGDKAILSICGVDGTESFEGQHMKQVQPNNQLDKFIIGKLSK